jgi:GT2 family glycosyltransferase
MSAMSHKAAFVVVGWNNKPLLKDCFDSITQQTYENTWIIYVDNDSADGSVEWVSKNFPEVTVLAQAKNTGFAKGNNIGIQKALEDEEVGFVGLINSDARLEPGWTKKIIDFAGLKPKGACFQGTTLDYYNHQIIDSTHIYLSRNGQGTQGSWRYYLDRESGPRKVFGVNAAACLISREFIETQPFTNFFDEALYMYLEDVDLAARATVMGWDNYLVPGARAYHMGSASSKAKSSTFSLYMTFRNNSAVLFKNLPFRLVFRMLPKLIKGDIDTIRTLWRTDRRSHVWAVVKGRLVGILRLPLFSTKKISVSHHRVIDTEYLWYLMRKGY